MKNRLRSFLSSHEAGLYAVRAFVVGAQFIVTALLAALLGPAEFGIFAALWASIYVTSSIISAGAPNFLLRELPGRHAEDETALPVGQTLRLTLVYPLAIATALYLGSRLFAPQSMLAGAASVVLPAAIAHNLLACLAIFVRMHAGNLAGMVARDGLPPLAVICATLFLWISPAMPTGSTVIGLFFWILAGAGLVVAVILFARGAITLSTTAAPYRSGLASFWGTSVLGNLSTNLDIIIAGAVFSPAGAGLYAFIRRLSNFISLPQVIANWSIALDVARHHVRGDLPGLKPKLQRSIMVAFLPALVFFAGMIATSPIWLSVFGFSVSPAAIGLVVVLASANLANVFFGGTFIVASQTGYERVSLIARIASVAGLGAIAAVTAATGDLGASLLAALTAASTLAMNLAVWSVLRAKLHLDTSALQLIPALLRRPTT